MTSNKLSGWLGQERQDGRNVTSRLATAATLFCALQGALAIAPEPLAEPVTLDYGIPHRQDIRAEQELLLQFNGTAGTSYVIEVDQGGLDLVLTVGFPDGQSRSFNSPLLRDDAELVVVDAVSDGVYTLRAFSEEYTGTVAHTSTRVSIPQGSERERLDALRLLSSASEANQRQDMEGWKQAIALYANAQALLLRISPVSQELARCLFSMATIEYWQIGGWERAARLAAEAADVYQAIGLQGLAASAIHLRAAALIEQANEVEKSAGSGLAPEAQALFDEALGLFADVRDRQQQLQHPYEVALATNNVGLTHYYMGDFDSAAAWWRDSADRFRSIREWAGELMSLENLGATEFERARMLSAVDTYERVLELLPAGHVNRQRANVMDNLGTAQLSLGRLDDALQSFSAALSLQREISDRIGEGRSLAGIGVTYYAIGERDLALDYLQTALAIRREANDGRGQVSVLNYIGNIHRQHGSYDLALEAHSEAQRLATAPIDRARGKVYIAQDLVAAARVDEALGALEQADAIAQATGNPKLAADVTRVSGEARLLAEQPARAGALYQDATDRYAELGLLAEQAEAQFGKARASRMQDLALQSVAEARTAIALAESVRSQMLDPELRAHFMSLRQDYHDFLVDALMSLHGQAVDGSDRYLREALEASERSRTRSLLDLMREVSAGGAAGGSAEIQAQYTSLYQQMAEARFRLDRLLDRPGDHAASITATRQELATIENELNLLDIESRKQNPALADPHILDSSEMQQMLQPDVALLQYDLGAKRSYLWRVTRQAVDAWGLPGRAHIETAVREAYEAISVPPANGKAQGELTESLSRLSDMLLGPLPELPQRRILVVPDGALHYLPFAVLADAGDHEHAIVSTHEIAYAPSLSTLSAQRSDRRDWPAGGDRVAIFADPVFAPEDPRLQARPAGARTESNELQRLPATAHEAAAIAGLLPSDRVFLALGFDASLEAITHSQLADYRVVHFATHGLIDSRYPALSALAFSQFDDEGNAVDGYLRLHDIYGLRLNADLVALSACSTALGREIAGEGLTGLTQGLMYAGARSVLASLWQVPDHATAELMGAFYRNLLAEDKAPAAALRGAQLELSQNKRWRDPYYWGAFVLQGALE